MPLIRVKISYNADVFEEIRRSGELDAILEQCAQQIADAAGPGFASSGAEPGATRSRAAVFTETAEAILSNAENNTLVTALDAGAI